MFYGFILQLIVYLMVITMIATSVTNNDASDVKLKYTKVELLYPKEDVILNATQMYIENLAAIPANIGALKTNNFLSNQFDVNNGQNGSYDITFVDGGRTLRVVQKIDDAVVRQVYKTHYLSKKYGMTPGTCTPDVVATNVNYCGAAFNAAVNVGDPDDGKYLYHDFPLRIQSTDALGL
jgi:hypothetical protein